MHLVTLTPTMWSYWQRNEGKVKRLSYIYTIDCKINIRASPHGSRKPQQPRQCAARPLWPSPRCDAAPAAGWCSAGFWALERPATPAGRPRWRTAETATGAATLGGRPGLQKLRPPRSAGYHRRESEPPHGPERRPDQKSDRGHEGKEARYRTMRLWKWSFNLLKFSRIIALVGV